MKVEFLKEVYKEALSSDVQPLLSVLPSPPNSSPKFPTLMLSILFSFSILIFFFFFFFFFSTPSLIPPLTVA